VTFKDSGGQERAQASGEIVTKVEPFWGQTCDRRGCKGPAFHDPVKCKDCGKTYARCSGHGGVPGAVRSLHSHRALYHPKSEAR
jgi:hypothetical protein